MVHNLANLCLLMYRFFYCCVSFTLCSIWILESLAGCPKYWNFCHQPTRYTSTHNTWSQLSAIKAWLLKYSRNRNGKRDVCARGCFFSYEEKNARSLLYFCTEPMLTNREIHSGRLKTNLWINGEPSTLHLAQKHLQKSVSLSPFILSRPGEQEWSNERTNERTGASEQYGKESE